MPRFDIGSKEGESCYLSFTHRAGKVVEAFVKPAMLLVVNYIRNLEKEKVLSALMLKNYRHLFN